MLLHVLGRNRLSTEVPAVEDQPPVFIELLDACFEDDLLETPPVVESELATPFELEDDVVPVRQLAFADVVRAETHQGGVVLQLEGYANLFDEGVVELAELSPQCLDVGHRASLPAPVTRSDTHVANGVGELAENHGRGQRSGMSLGALLALGSPVMWWFSHEINSDSEPLVWGPGVAAYFDGVHDVFREMFGPLAWAGTHDDRDRKDTEANWVALLASLANGQEDEGLLLGGEGGDVTVYNVGRYEGWSGWCFQTRVPVQATTSRHVRFVLEAARRLAQDVEATTGYVTFEQFSWGASPFEDAHNVRSKDVVLRQRQLLRGFYWGNFLSSRHLHRLGGIERVLR